MWRIIRRIGIEEKRPRNPERVSNFPSRRRRAPAGKSARCALRAVSKGRQQISQVRREAGAGAPEAELLRSPRGSERCALRAVSMGLRRRVGGGGGGNSTF